MLLPGLARMRQRLVLGAGAALFLAGCLPSSGRGGTTSLLPSDSLSRRVADAAPVDTLVRVWSSAPGTFDLPTSIAWVASGGGAGRLVVADTRAGALRLFDALTGTFIPASATAEALGYPYLAGAVHDTVAVLVRGEDRLIWILLSAGAMRAVHSAPVPAGATAALVASAGTWVKRSDEREAWLVRIDRAGAVIARYPLPGPSWRRIGFLRARGDSLLSLSGYRPVVDVLAPGAPAGAAPDTLALVGFDSPQMVRSHRFIRGEADQPPLLTSSAVALGDRLLVINLRGDHLRVDVFDADGRLERALVYPAPEATHEHFPVDIAARRDSAGALIALVMQRPGGVLSEPGGYVLMLRWQGPPTPS